MKQILRQIKGRFLRKVRKFRGGIGFLSIYIMKNIDAHYPNSGNWQPNSKLLLRNINQFHSQMIQILETQNPLKTLKKFDVNLESIESEIILDQLFNKYGSDKAKNGYSSLYTTLISNLNKIEKPNESITIMEIGIGSNNPSIPSNMGANGKPGASLKAFRDFNVKIECIGFDIDSKILFNENRIKTFAIDQQDFYSFSKTLYFYKSKWPGLMIDDGLHSPYANINSLLCFMQFSTYGNYLVVEDIPKRTVGIWELINQLISDKNFLTWIYESELGGRAIVVKNIRELTA